jgi:hypothetical protein
VIISVVRFSAQPIADIPTPDPFLDRNKRFADGTFPAALSLNRALAAATIDKYSQHRDRSLLIARFPIFTCPSGQFAAFHSRG